MRDRETIDSELRLLAGMRRSMREPGGEPSSRRIDELLDERLGHRADTSETAAEAAGETGVGVDTRSRRGEIHGVAPYRRKGVLRRFGLPAALPLSLLAGAALLVVVFTVPDQHPAAQPAEVPPSSGQPAPAAPKPPAPPLNHAPPLQLVDRAFIDTLKQEGVPVPSPEYVMTQGHAACDFLARQPDFAEAVRFVQRSSIWDANQSTEVAAGAIVAYCPQYQPASYQPGIPDQLQQAFQNALSDLQAIQGDLQGIRDDLPTRQP
jgi:Protein of unknown function (DUF732)